ncbi:MAG: hypothetical protein Q8N97_00900 [Methanobacteriaceae archaeon]|nr:hypothetical protein [Methanobacteriaceae archaeon]MDP3485178.1 hypothetical protein [Methanobacteriaceae archaeon]MDP3622643.1 hypothetical protein [Methanobacteriaceae archaeon]
MDYKTVVIAVMAVIVVLLAGVNAIFLISPSEDMNNSSQLALGNNTTTNTSYSVNNSNSTEEPSHKVVYNKTIKNNTTPNPTKHNTTTNTTKPVNNKTKTIN